MRPSGFAGFWSRFTPILVSKFCYLTQWLLHSFLLANDHTLTYTTPQYVQTPVSPVYGMPDTQAYIICGHFIAAVT